MTTNYKEKVAAMFEAAADIDRASIFKQPGMVRETVPKALGLLDDMQRHIEHLENELAASQAGKTILNGRGGFTWKVKL